MKRMQIRAPVVTKRHGSASSPDRNPLCSCGYAAPCPEPLVSIKDLTVDCRLSFSIFWNAKAFLANLNSLLALCVDLARRQPTSLLRGLLSAHLQAESRQRRRLLPPRRRWIGARPESVGADVQPPQAVPLPSEDDARDRRREPRLAGAPLALERHPAPNAPAPSSSRTR